MTRRRPIVVALFAAATVAACEAYSRGESPAAPAPEVDAGMEAGTFDDAEATTDAPAADAPADAPPASCDPRAPFLNAQPLHLLNGAGPEARPSLTANELQIVFSSAATVSPNDFKIYTASRAATSDAFATSELVSELTVGGGLLPNISPDGLRIVFTVRNGVDLDLSEATRGDGKGTFKIVESLAALNTASLERSPSYSADGERVYFTSNRPGGAPDYDTLYVARRGAEGFSAPERILDGATKLPLAGYSPVASADGKYLYFGRANADGLSRIVIGELSPEGNRLDNIMPINTPEGASFGAATDVEGPGYVSTDHCRLYFAAGPPSNTDLWMASRR